MLLWLYRCGKGVLN